MKINKWIWIAGVAGTLISANLRAQNDIPDSTGLPGENFSLEGALEMFQKAESPEAFEKLLNDPESRVNNLDLNGDGEIDYVRVIDRSDGSAHAIILQDVVSDQESQDVAVIELDRQGDDNAVLQIVGDRDLYGDEVIVEPAPQRATPNATVSNVTVNVWTWPAVRYVYRPAYTVWVSPWGWRARPIWWHPWRPVRYHVFYPYRAPYRQHYVVVHTHRVVRARTVYAPVRTTSVIVRTRHEAPVRNYRATQSTHTVTGPRGRSATRSTTTVEGRRRSATRSTTTVESRRGSTSRSATTVQKTRGTNKATNTAPARGKRRARGN